MSRGKRDPSQELRRLLELIARHANPPHEPWVKRVRLEDYGLPKGADLGGLDLKYAYLRGLDFGKVTLPGESTSPEDAPLLRANLEAGNLARLTNPEALGGAAYARLVGAVLPGGAKAAPTALTALPDVRRLEPLPPVFGHSGPVSAVSVLPDGRVVSGSDDNTLRVWDLERGEAVQVLEGHRGSVLSLAVLPDGRVVSGSDDNTLRVWDLERGEAVQVLEGHENWVLSLAVLPDGRVVSGSRDNTLRVWDLERGKAVQVLEEHEGPVNALAVFSGGQVVSGSDDGTLRVWDLERGEAEAYYLDPQKQASIRVAPDGSLYLRRRGGRGWATRTHGGERLPADPLLYRLAWFRVDAHHAVAAYHA
ncbi:WD40 repeat domain-containing protein, partial [Oceanithermus sp.]